MRQGSEDDVHPSGRALVLNPNGALACRKIHHSPRTV